jgi:hypothetical protein
MIGPTKLENAFNLSKKEVCDLLLAFKRAKKEGKWDEKKNLVEIAMKMANDYLPSSYGVNDVYVSKIGKTIALYVSRGYTYDETILYDIENDDFIITSWGDFLEWYEIENDLNDYCDI